MAGPERDRIAEVIAETDEGACRGSGYRVTERAVLTAAHVVCGASSIRVRFSSDLPGQWEAQATVAVADPAADIAVLELSSPGPGDSLIPVVFGAPGQRAVILDCMAVGFPRFKLRKGAGGTRYRDSYQANGTISPLANWREGTLEMLVPPPAPDPEPGHSPWEGMSGAAVWCKGRIIGVVSKHHPGDGLGTLAAARLDGLYRVLDARSLAVSCELARFPEHPGQLADCSDPAYAGEMDCPYRGLEPFGQAHARFFFGRREVVTALTGILAREPFAALVGASGSGKSSVLSAGLIPAACAGIGEAAYHCERITPTDRPVRQLADALSRWLGISAGELSGDAPAQIQELLNRMPPRPPLLLIADQMEELHTQCADDQERRAFIRGLLALLSGGDPQNRVVIGVRTDFYAECRDDPDLGPAMRNRQVDLWPMGRGELRAVMEKPAALAGLHIDPRLTELLLEDVGSEPGRLPLLSHALLATFERRQGPQLTTEDYIAAGRVQGALDKTANEVYENLSPEEQDEARAILLRCAAGDGTIPDTRRPVPRADLDAGTFPRADAVVGHLASARLITLTTRRAGQQGAAAEEEIIEVAHEALLRSWGQMKGWLALYRPYRPAHQGLMTAARKWADSGRSPEWLYQEGNLQEARQLLTRHSPVRLTRTERDFLDASQAQTRRRTRRFRLMASGLALAVLAAGGGAAAAVSQSGRTNTQHQIGLAGKVAAEASSVAPGLARQLLVGAYRIARTDQTEGPLLDSQSIPREYDFRGLVRAAAYSTRAPLLAAGTDQGVTLMNATTGTVISAMPSTTGAVSSAAFDPRSDLLVTGDRDGYLRLWDITNPARPSQEKAIRFSQSGVDRLAFTPGGLLALTLDNNAVGLLDVTGPASPVVLSALPGFSGASLYPAMALSPDGRVLAAASPDDTVRLWDIANPAHPSALATMAGPSPDVDALAFSPDGHILAGGGWLNSTIRVWDVTNPRRPQSRPGLSSPAMDGPALAFSPAGETLAVAAGSTVQVWNLADPVNPAQVATLTSHSKTVNTVAFSPDGQTLATGSDDQTLLLQDVTDAGYSEPLAEIKANAEAPAVFSPDGRFMVAGNPSVLWDVSNPLRPAEMAPIPAGLIGDAQQVAFSPDSRLAGTQAIDGTTTLWDLADPRHPDPVARWHAQPGAIAFTGSHTLADAAGLTIFRWDISAPGHPRALNSLRVPPALSQPASLAGSGALLGLADPAANQVITSLAGHHKGATLLATSPDGRTLAMAEPGQNVSSGQIVTLWDVSQAPAVELATLSVVSSLSQAAFSPDGKILAFADPQGMSLWDISAPAHPALITTLTHGGGFTTATFSPAGNLLATVSSDSRVELWDMNFASLISRLCSGTGTPVTQSQWNKYVPGTPYARPCPAGTRAGPGSTVLAAATPASLPRPAASPPASAQRPSLNLRSVNWADASIPGQYCDVPGTVRLRAGQANATSTWWGPVQFLQGGPVIYGNLGGQAQQVAAVRVTCTNGGGTADGQLVDAYLIFTGADGKLTALGAITPQERAGDVHVPLFTRLSISPGTVITREEWYRQNDATCCPTGKATTVWTYAGGTFLPGTPDITS